MEYLLPSRRADYNEFYRIRELIFATDLTTQQEYILEFFVNADPARLANTCFIADYVVHTQPRDYKVIKLRYAPRYKRGSRKKSR